MDKINLIISLLALIVAILTTFAAHYYYVKSDQKRKREILLDAIRSIDKFKVMSHNVVHE